MEKILNSTDASIDKYTGKPIAGAYVIEHEETGVRYFGSTSDLYARRKQHESALRHGKHSIKELQAAYTEKPEFLFIPIITNDRELAFDIEQSLIDSANLSQSPPCNLATNARKSALGYPRTDEIKKILSDKNKIARKENPDLFRNSRRPPGDKKVSIEGIVYDNQASAAAALGVSYNTIYNRVRSKTDAFPDWKLAE